MSTAIPVITTKLSNLTTMTGAERARLSKDALNDLLDDALQHAFAVMRAAENNEAWARGKAREVQEANCRIEAAWDEIVNLRHEVASMARLLAKSAERATSSAMAADLNSIPF